MSYQARELRAGRPVLHTKRLILEGLLDIIAMNEAYETDAQWEASDAEDLHTLHPEVQALIDRSDISPEQYGALFESTNGRIFAYLTAIEDGKYGNVDFRVAKAFKPKGVYDMTIARQSLLEMLEGKADETTTRGMRPLQEAFKIPGYERITTTYTRATLTKVLLD
jgi:hypothetical protein